MRPDPGDVGDGYPCIGPEIVDGGREDREDGAAQEKIDERHYTPKTCYQQQIYNLKEIRDRIMALRHQFGGQAIQPVEMARAQLSAPRSPARAIMRDAS